MSVFSSNRSSVFRLSETLKADYRPCFVCQHFKIKMCIRDRAEVTPHHFTLDETAVLKHGTLAKMNPPLRTAKDREALIEGLKSGAIDIIATDHAPHSREEKEKPLTAAPSGIIGLETALPLAVTNLVKEGHLTYVQLFEKMCLNPARLYRLDSGRIKEGSDADLVIFDDRESFTVGDFVSRSSNSPLSLIHI